ncbi:Mu transposase C-terminal domain-containing protein [Spirosoma sp. SC4-14]|uniref:Mu transposase C-terminal domain-containing protein n=1 Tax=Spirosoma sp. SC4-14 TaxID=3128900 RepID=UPI0030D4B551
MKLISDISYIALSDLVELCGIESDTIERGYRRGSKQWQSIADPDDRRKRLIRYDTMADRYKGIVRRVLCNGFEPGEIPAQTEGQLLSERSLPERLQLVCIEGYKQYIGLYPVELSDAKHRQKTQIALARAAAIVETIGRYVIETGQDWRDYTPYEQAIEWLTPDYDQYFPIGHQYLPMEVKNLKERVLMRYIGKKEKGQEREQVPMPITEVIRLPRQGNQNRDLYSDDQELLSWVVQARMSGQNYTDAHVARKVQQVCQLTGKPVPSDRWVTKLLQSPKIRQLTTGRWGNEGGRAAVYQHYHSFKRAMYAGDCWQVDATRINFVEHKAFDGKGTQFLFIVAIRDVYSGDIVGVDFGVTENRWTYVNAFKMAVNVTGHLPHTLVYDRFPGHLTDEIQAVLNRMEAKGVKMVCTHNAQGKAAVERWFDTLQTVFLAQSRYYYGQGIRSTRPSAHRSATYLDKLRKEATKEGWDFDKAWQEAWRCVEVYRHTQLSEYSKQHKRLELTPAQLYEQSEKPHVIEVQSWWVAELFWLEKEVTVLRNQIKFTVDHQEYVYQIFDKEFLYQYSGKKVAVRYDDTDLDRVMLFVPGTDQFLLDLEETKRIAIHGPNADSEELGRRMAQVKRFEVEKEADLKGILTNTSDIDLMLGSKTDKAASIAAESAMTRVVYDSMGATMTAKLKRQAKAASKPSPTVKPIPKKVIPTALDDDPYDPNKYVRY